MSARDKTGLGYGTQLNEMSNNSETDSEISLSVFYVRSSDEENTPTNDMFFKADRFHAIPPPITGNFLTPRADISFAGKTNETNTQKPKTVYESVNRDKVIIEDWNSDDEDDVSEVQTVSPVKTNETQTSQEPKLKTVVNTGPRVDKPVWDNTKRETAVLSTTEEGLQAISATIDGHEKLITEASLRRHLKLEDAEGISSLSNEEIFEQLAQWVASKRQHGINFSSIIAYSNHLLATRPGGVEIDGLEKDLQQTKKTYSTALTKLVLRVKKLEYKLKSGKARRKAKIVFFPDYERDCRGFFQTGEEDFLNLIVQEETPTEIIEEHGSGEKGEMEISTASPPKVTKVSTAEAHVYTRRSAKDKGKAIMKEPATPKKVKKGTQVQLSMDEELARKMEEEERARFNAEQEARALQKKTKQIKEKKKDKKKTRSGSSLGITKNNWMKTRCSYRRHQSKGIDWNDPSVLRYHALKNKPVSIAQARRNMITYLKNQGGYKESYFKRMSYNDIRPIFERVWDHVNTFIPIGSEVEKGSSKPSKRETSKTVEEEKVEKEDVKPDPLNNEKKHSKRQKKEKESDDFEQEKEDLRMWLSVLKDEEESVTPEFLSVRYPIVNWEYQLHGRMEMKDMEAYKLTRADGTISFHKNLKIILRKEKELSFGELRMMFDLDEQDEIWKNQESWKVLRWRLYENSGVHSVFLTDTPMEINMLVEKKYPLKKEILEKMINFKL
ncbi:hypothetical protein Tco_1104273 [Tanacetum coccineum]